MDKQYEVKKVDWNSHAKAIETIRRQVFIEEQNVPETEEWDGLDSENTVGHFVAINQENQVCGCIRLIRENKHYKITRLAVTKEHRKRGIADALLRSACQTALSQPIERLYLHAQTSAKSIYLKQGFEIVSDIFLDAGIEHVEMEFDKRKPEALGLIFLDKVIRLQYPQDFLNHSVNILQSGQRQVDICSKGLRDDIFAKEDFVRALSYFARNDRRATVRILVHDTKNLSRRIQSLIELSRRLPSKIKIQSMSPTRDDAPPSFISVDCKKLIFFNNEEQLDGFCCYQAGPECESILEKYEHAWNHLSFRDPNLASLNL